MNRYSEDLKKLTGMEQYITTPIKDVNLFDIRIPSFTKLPLLSDEVASIYPVFYDRQSEQLFVVDENMANSLDFPKIIKYPFKYN